MEIIILIARILLLIAEGTSPSEAVSLISSKSGLDYNTLWNHLPHKYK